MTTIARFLSAALANLIADLAQVENLLGGFALVSGTIVAATQNTPAGKIVAGVVAVAGAATIALPKVVAFLKGAEGELEQLLHHANTSKPVAPPHVIPHG